MKTCILILLFYTALMMINIFAGEGGWFVIFRLFKSILFFVLIEFYCTFSILIKFYQIMFIIIVLRSGCDIPSGLLLFVPSVLFSILTPLFCQSSSVSLSYFILAVHMRECLEKHSCMSSLFPIAILNGTSSFFSFVQENINMPSGHYYTLCSCSGS